MVLITFEWLKIKRNLLYHSSSMLKHSTSEEDTIILPNVESRTNFHAHTHALTFSRVLCCCFANAAHSLSSSAHTHTALVWSLSPSYPLLCRRSSPLCRESLYNLCLVYVHRWSLSTSEMQTITRILSALPLWLDVKRMGEHFPEHRVVQHGTRDIY
jgi:hypothetical protein